MQKTLCVRGYNVQIVYQPRLIRRNMITSVNINGRPLYNELQNSYFQTNGRTVSIDPHVWTLSNLIFDVIKEIRNTDEDNKLALHLADYLFNRFGGIYQTLLQNNLLMPSVSLWIQVCRKIWEWEDSNSPITIHKGTPYYFLAFTLANLGNWDSTFTFVFNAIKEDKASYSQTSFPEKYKASPAYRFATLVDNKANTFYPYVKDMKARLLKLIRNFRRFTRLRFKYANFESKFLRKTQLEEIVFVFVYQLQYFLSQESMTIERIRQNEFSKLRNLNVIFNLCLIVDKALEFRYVNRPKKERETIAKNIFNFFKEKRWIRNERNAGDLKEEFRNSGTNLEHDPDTIVPKIIAKNVQYHGNVIRSEMAPLLLTWHLRNYGGHNIKAQDVLVNEYPKIVEFILYSLFLALS